MINASKSFACSYGQRTLVEFWIVVLIIAMLLAIAVKIMPTYIKISKLVWPLSFAQEVQTHMAIDAALTGRWPREDNIPINLNRWQDAIQEFEVNQFGSISITLHKELGFEDNNVLGFNLNPQEQNTAFRFYSWHCGASVSPISLFMAEPVKTTVPPIISHTICRK